MTITYKVCGVGGAGATSPAVDTSGSDLIVAANALYGGGAGTVTDSKGNSWTTTTQYMGDNASDYIRHSYCINPTVGTNHTVTGSGSYYAVAFLAFAGANGGFDQTVGDGDPGPGTVTPTEDNSVVVCSLCHRDTAPTIAGMTRQTYNEFHSGVHMGIAMAYLIQTTKTANNPTWGNCGSSAQCPSTQSVFKRGFVGIKHNKRMILTLGT